MTRHDFFELLPIVVLVVIAFLYTVGYAIDRLPEDYYSFLNGMLFFLTAIYVWLTLRILKDNQKSREIEFIERQLEKLYYPLKDVLVFNKFPGNITKDQLREEDCRSIDDIIPYQYLIENETRGQLSRYIDIFISMQKMDVPKVHLVPKSEELFQAIEIDIKYLNNRLDELIH